ncbi:C1GALT1-specific chaperone [Dirofilaria immitis]
MRKVILILSRLVAICRKQSFSSNPSLKFTIGILIGILIGFCATVNYNDEISTSITQSFLINQRKQQLISINFNTSILSDIQLQCIIFIHPKQLFKWKYVEAIRDTYTKQCNHTIYITNSNDIRRKFSENLNIAFVNTNKTQYHWDLYRQIIIYSAKYNKTQYPYWTIIGDEQTFIVMTNLRKLLSTINNPKQSLILGRIITRRNILSYLFPWNVYTTILPHAGIVFSRSALKYLANDKCFGWLSPRATERALIQCINLMNIQLIDPIDKEGKHLFDPGGLKKLFERNGSKNPKKITNESLHCCSDEAVSFGDLNYHNHRILHFITNKIKVFGY